MSDLDHPAPDVFAAARTRRSIRAYKADPVPIEIVREIVALGRHAPSGSNIQPWHVHVLTGATTTITPTRSLSPTSRAGGNAAGACTGHSASVAATTRNLRLIAREISTSSARRSASSSRSTASSKKAAGSTTGCSCRRLCSLPARRDSTPVPKRRSRITRTSCGAS